MTPAPPRRSSSRRNAVAGLGAALRSAWCTVSDAEYESVRDEGRLTVTLDVHAPGYVPLEALLRATESQPDVVHARTAPPS